MKPRLHTIICSTRPGRVGPAVADWFHEHARRHDGFDAVLVDLADFALPVYDEPQHPSLQKYEKEHTKRWAASVAGADAYAFVLPEYNYGPPPSFVNALDFVYREWNYKPCGFVSYGGISGGLRAVEHLRQVFAELYATTIRETVSFHAGDAVASNIIVQSVDPWPRVAGYRDSPANGDRMAAAGERYALRR